MMDTTQGMCRRAKEGFDRLGPPRRVRAGVITRTHCAPSPNVLCCARCFLAWLVSRASDVCLMKFSLGQIVITPKATELLSAAQQRPEDLLNRHQQGDWGDISDEEKRLNDEGLVRPLNLVSVYRLSSGHSVTVFTKADRSVTMLHVSPTILARPAADEARSGAGPA